MMTIASLLTTTDQNKIGFIHVRKILFIMHFYIGPDRAFFITPVKIEFIFIDRCKKVGDAEEIGHYENLQTNLRKRLLFTEMEKPCYGIAAVSYTHLRAHET